MRQVFFAFFLGCVATNPVLAESFTLARNNNEYVVADPADVPIGGAKLSFGYGWPPFDPISLVQIPITPADEGTTWTITADNYADFGVTPAKWQIIEDGFLAINPNLPRDSSTAYWHIKNVTYTGPTIGHPFLWTAVEGVAPALDADVRIDELRMTLHVLGTPDHPVPPHTGGDGWWAQASFAIVGEVVPEPSSGLLLLLAIVLTASRRSHKRA
jgi:hypothetical protein